MCGIYYFTYPCHRRGFLCFLNFACSRVYKFLLSSTTCVPLPNQLPEMLKKQGLLVFYLVCCSHFSKVRKVLDMWV